MKNVTITKLSFASKAILANFIIGALGSMIFDWVMHNALGHVSAQSLLDYVQPVSSDFFDALPGAVVGVIYVAIWRIYSRFYFGVDDRVFLCGVAAAVGGVLLWLVPRMIAWGFFL